MKRFWTTLLMLSMLLTCWICPALAAETVQQDGIIVTLLTDREIYAAGEPIRVTLNVQNTNPFPIQNVYTEVTAPEGILLIGGERTFVGELAAGATFTQEITSTEKELDVPVLPQTGDNSHIGMWIVLLMLSFVGGVYLTVFRRNGAGARWMSLFLCLLMVGSLLPVGGFARAEDVQKTITVTKTVTYDNQLVTLTGIVTYDAVEDMVEPTATPTAEPVPTPTLSLPPLPTLEVTATPTAEPVPTPTLSLPPLPTSETTDTPTATPTATPTPTPTPTLNPNCKHVDEYYYPLIGEELDVWQEYMYNSPTDHVVFEYTKYLCSACGLENTWCSEWYDDHHFDEDGYCQECEKTAAGATPAPPSEEEYYSLVVRFIDPDTGKPLSALDGSIVMVSKDRNTDNPQSLGMSDVDSNNPLELRFSDPADPAFDEPLVLVFVRKNGDWAAVDFDFSENPHCDLGDITLTKFDSTKPYVSSRKVKNEDGTVTFTMQVFNCYGDVEYYRVYACSDDREIEYAAQELASYTETDTAFSFTVDGAAADYLTCDILTSEGSYVYDEHTDRTGFGEVRFNLLGIADWYYFAIDNPINTNWSDAPVTSCTATFVMSTTEAAIDVPVSFTVTSKTAEYVKLVVDGTEYESYPLTNGTATFERSFSKAGVRSVQMLPYDANGAGQLSAAQTLTVTETTPVITVTKPVISNQFGVTYESGKIGTYSTASGMLTLKWTADNAAKYKVVVAGLNEEPDFGNSSQLTSDNRLYDDDNVDWTSVPVSVGDLQKYKYLKVAIGAYDVNNTSGQPDVWTTVGIEIVLTDDSGNHPEDDDRMSAEYKTSQFYQELKKVNLSGIYAQDIVAVAKSQIGYLESEDFTGIGEYKDNHTEYNNFYSVADVSWCAYFVCWCAGRSGVPDTAISLSGAACPFELCPDATEIALFLTKEEIGRVSTSYKSYLENDNVVFYNNDPSQFIPQPGDLIFFHTADKSFMWGHVGIVTGRSGNTVYFIDGNNNGNGSPKDGTTNVIGKVYERQVDYTDAGNYVIGFARPNY